MSFLMTDLVVSAEIFIVIGRWTFAIPDLTAWNIFPDHVYSSNVTEAV